MKVRDRVIRAAACGIIAGTPDTLINALEYQAGLTDLTYGQMGASAFLPKSRAKEARSQVIGYLANYLMLGLSGIAFDCVLSKTGREHPVLKGLGFGLATWAGIYLLSQILGFTPRARKARAPLLSMVDHAIFGTLLGLITPHLTGQSLSSPGSALPAIPKLSEDEA